MKWKIVILPVAKKQLAAIKDRRIQEVIRRRIDRLEHEPDRQGKPMRDELVGFRSIRAVGQRYRILYTLEEQQVTVLVVTVGIRKEGDKQDVYAVARFLLQRNMLYMPDNSPEA
jgi:mRNA interferase RelE/StbE